MSVTKSELVAVRDIRPEDKNFIFASWLRGLRYGNDTYKAVESDTFFKAYHKKIELALAKPDTSVKVACLKDDPEVILGYAVYTGPCLHWVFVKKAWRSIGIAKSLVPQTISQISHLTTVGVSIIGKHSTVKFNPFAFGQ